MSSPGESEPGRGRRQYRRSGHAGPGAQAARGYPVGGRAIAREAGVGIATLYRHFPTRESLIDAVYRDQVARLTDAARELLAQLPPPAALRRWMDLFGDWIATGCKIAWPAAPATGRGSGDS
ncbi:MAG TPA: TetR/AcrR family transcriptional regulator [Streptosporangiaceae bacterium]|nr:TetR/AcrR family transcriptional regulator [Streptosporangiaceae bacterium]